MLEVRDLRVTYGTTVAVDGVDLSVGAGEIVGLLGPNGGGQDVAAASGQPGRGVRGPDRVRRRRPRRPEPRRRGAPRARPGAGRAATSSRTCPSTRTCSSGPRPGRARAASSRSTTCTGSSRRCGRSGSAAGGRCRAASSRWWRSAAACSPRRACCCSTSRRWGSPPPSSTTCSTCSREVARHVPMLLVEQNTDRVLALAQRAYVLVKGRVVMEGAATSSRIASP